MVLAILSGCGESSPVQPEVSTAITDTIRCIEVVQISGSAAVIHSDGTTEKLSVGSKLVESDNIVTSNDCVLTLTLDGNKTITVDPSSSIFVHSLTADGTNTVLAIEDGGIASSVDGLEEGDVYEVCTRDTTMAIRGTDVFVGYSKDKGTTVLLLTGSAIVLDYASNVVYNVPTGQTSTIKPNTAPIYSLVKDSSVNSDAVSAMKKRVKDENPDFEKDFVTEICADNTIKTDYEFFVTESVIPDTQSAETIITEPAPSKPTSVKKYTVTFGYYENGTFKTISSAKVKSGGNAAEPDAPNINGYAFTGWDGSFSNITGDKVILAQFVKKATVVFSDISISSNGTDYTTVSAGTVHSTEFTPGESVSYTYHHTSNGMDYSFTYTAVPYGNGTDTINASSQPDSTSDALLSRISCTVTDYDPTIISDISA